MLKISMDDNISPLAKYWLAENPRFLQSLSKSLGWFVSRNVKQLTNDTKLTGRWKPRTSQRFRKALARKGSAPTRWLGKMRSAVVYEYKGNNVSLVGWASRSSAWYGSVFEEGFDVEVTTKVRRYYAKKGCYVPKNGTINMPERPIYSPAMEIINPQIPGFVQSKVERYMAKGRQGFKAPTRLYEVYK